MNISDKYKLIFFHFPKSAGKSVVKALDIKTSDKTNLESGLRQTIGFGIDYRSWNETVYPDKWNNYTKFTIIRNPWDRIVSLYNFRKKENDLYNMCISQLDMNVFGGNKLGPGGTEWSFKRWIFSLFAKGFAGPAEDKLHQLQKEGSFSSLANVTVDQILSLDSKTLEEAKQFHKYLVYDNFYIESCMSREKIPVMAPEGLSTRFMVDILRERIEWLNQIDVMSGLYSEILVDYVLRFEHLDRDWNNMFKELDYEPPKLPIINKYKHKHYSEYYDDETREFIGWLFKKDVDAFGYKFKHGE